jgi:hypothetical protein
VYVTDRIHVAGDGDDHGEEGELLLSVLFSHIDGKRVTLPDGTIAVLPYSMEEVVDAAVDARVLPVASQVDSLTKGKITYFGYSTLTTSRGQLGLSRFRAMLGGRSPLVPYARVSNALPCVERLAGTVAPLIGAIATAVAIAFGEPQQTNFPLDQVTGKTFLVPCEDAQNRYTCRPHVKKRVSRSSQVGVRLAGRVGNDYNSVYNCDVGAQTAALHRDSGDGKDALSLMYGGIGTSAGRLKENDLIVYSRHDGGAAVRVATDHVQFITAITFKSQMKLHSNVLPSLLVKDCTTGAIDYSAYLDTLTAGNVLVRIIPFTQEKVEFFVNNITQELWEKILQEDDLRLLPLK